MGSHRYCRRSGPCPSPLPHLHYQVLLLQEEAQEEGETQLG